MPGLLVSSLAIFPGEGEESLPEAVAVGAWKSGQVRVTGKIANVRAKVTFKLNMCAQGTHPSNTATNGALMLETQMPTITKLTGNQSPTHDHHMPVMKAVSTNRGSLEFSPDPKRMTATKQHHSPAIQRSLDCVSE